MAKSIQNKMKPTISVIVPVYNTPIAYLKSCIASVVSQTARSLLELVVFDDGSSPTYKEQLRTLLSDIDTIPVSFDETDTNRGLCYARNDAVELSSGQYLLFLDSDDYLHETAAEKCLAAFQEEETVLVYTNHVHVSSDATTIIHTRDKRVYQRLLEEFKGTLFDPLLYSTFIFHCQTIRRDAFLRAGGFRVDLGYGDEVDLHLRLSELSHAVNFRLAPEFLYFYRKNPSSIVHNPGLYTLLINNIESLLAEAAQRRGLDVVRAKRVGRALPTYAAHYALFDSEQERIEVPYFEYETCQIKPDYL